jgi:iron complex transport system substrate-binding protein
VKLCRAQTVFSVLVLAVLAIPWAAPESNALGIVDDLDRTIEIVQPARRVIPLYGAFAEMLYAVGAGPQLVARTQADRHPAEIEQLPSVGTHMKPNVELIIGLKPDLVIQSASRHDAMPELDRLREASIPVAVFSPMSLDEIFSTMARLGVLTGHESSAERAVALLRERLQRVRTRVSGVEKPSKVFYEVRSEPLTAAGQGSIVQKIIEAAGAQNVVSNEKGIVQFNFEALLVADPDIYIVQKGPMNRNPAEPAKRPHFDQLRSVREGKVIYVDELMVSRPGPRSVDAVEELARAIYPERFQSE